ncbi:hypothetical protein [Oceanobacillus kapialis]|uniref:Uncharacterized protein n=1 Tax=Oceanobacillus kapialis TaxID=481353 RepID=A0ABW5Q320_9BACI
MGLYIDRNKHHNLFKNEGALKEPNQRVYIRNHVAEMIREQRKVNHSIHQQQLQMKLHNDMQADKNAKQWNEMLNKLEELQQSNVATHSKGDRLTQHLHQLEEKNTRMEQLLEASRITNKELVQQVEEISSAQKEMMGTIHTREKEGEHLQRIVELQTEWQQNVETKLANQEENQKSIMASMENQEAVSEKLSRQVEQLRSTLFERTSFLAEKIEENYRIIASYVTKLLTGSDKQVTLFRVERKQNKD